MASNNYNSKLILASGTDYGTGCTTIMNYVAIELAKHGSVLLIEFKLKTGFSIYMNRGHSERRRSLTDVINIPEKLSENVIRSPHNPSMFYLCTNIYEDCLKVMEYQGFKLIDIIKEAKKIFDYVIVDLPANPNEKAVGVAYGKDILYKPDHSFLFVDERVSSFKYLNDFNAILQLSGETNYRDTTFVINKIYTTHYHDYIEEYLPSLPITKPVNKVWLPFLPELITACNSGHIYETGKTDDAKLFFKQIDTMVDIIVNDRRGLNLSKETMDRQKEVEVEKGLFGFKKKKKVSILDTQEEKAEHNKKIDEQLAEQDEIRRLQNEHLYTTEEYSELDVDNLLMVHQNENDDEVLFDATGDDEVIEPVQETSEQQEEPTDKKGKQKKSFFKKSK